jgi:chitin disaccharide deacetylase
MPVRRVVPTVLWALLATAAWAQQKNAAEKLGYPAGTKLLMIHADDLGLAHSVNRATFEALDSGAVTSTSIMVPCPWLTEVADYARTHPAADLGLHLTLTSEWKTYRWGPVESRNLVASLTDPAGCLWPETAPVFSKARPEEVERELRAQIELALRLGIRPTHVDSHMGAVFSPTLLPAYLKVAREFKLPFFAVRSPALPASMLSLLRDDDVFPDSYQMANSPLKAGQWFEFYEGIVRNLKPGLTEVIVHLGYDDAELQAIMVDHPAFGSAWRQRDFDVLRSERFRKLLASGGVKLVGWKDLAVPARRP